MDVCTGVYAGIQTVYYSSLFQGSSAFEFFSSFNTYMHVLYLASNALNLLVQRMSHWKIRGRFLNLSLVPGQKVSYLGTQFYTQA
jgi:hypothetical protein